MATLIPGRIQEICLETFEDPREDELEKHIKQLAIFEAEREIVETEVVQSDAESEKSQPAAAAPRHH